MSNRFLMDIDCDIIHTKEDRLNYLNSLKQKLEKMKINPKEIMADFKKYRPHVIPAVPRLFEVIRNRIIDQIKTQHKWWLASSWIEETCR